jgi:hypothetical protein
MAKGITERITGRATRHLEAANTTHEIHLRTLDVLASLDRIEKLLGVVNHRVDHLETQFAELDRGVEVLMASDLAIQRTLTREANRPAATSDASGTAPT